jgi:hypothetical protein
LKRELKKMERKLDEERFKNMKELEEIKIQHKEQIYSQLKEVENENLIIIDSLKEEFDERMTGLKKENDE